MIRADRVREQADGFQAESVRVRRHLHMHPELSFGETETAAFVANELRTAGIEHAVGVAGNGVVAIVEGSGGRGGGNGDGGRPVVALRADMDALPIRETTEQPYCSTTDGVMHACGHDGHTACLLTAARILSSLRAELPGAVKLIFQPAEERAPGGARPMIESGVLEAPRVSRVFGQHVNTDLDAGTVGFASGLFMASADEIYMTVRGRGGHAAKPHEADDPVVIAATLIVALQQLVSRNADPTVPSVLTFGRFVGNGAANVIPDSVELAGTFRTMDERWRGEALDRLRRTADTLVRSLGAAVEIRIVPGYPAVVNDPGATAFARSRAVDYLGEDRVVDIPPVMWAEDFAFYGLRRPSCFYNLGVRNRERGIVHPVHTARFDLDEDALRIGSGLLAWIAIGALESGSS
jgi:amidohydrolase